MHILTYQYQICIFIGSAFADRHFMVTVYIMGSHNFSRDSALSVLCAYNEILLSAYSMLLPLTGFRMTHSIVPVSICRFL